jgi:ABC-type nitrate/sulfonate/bicarbonate transport system substrate-binding protein
MTQQVSFTIGGVPEHFNLPWHSAIEEGLFKQASIDLSWKSYPGGTGAMVKDLRNGSLDIAILLTEGIVADIAKGNPAKIISLFVKSPLLWGIHVPASSPYYSMPEVEGKRYAISRIGSGSHLMAYVDARQRGWQLKEDQLVLVGDLQGARDAFKSNQADIFMWERFMTQPLVDQGEFRRIGECPTPWPCFVVAVREDILRQNKSHLQRIMQIIYQANTSFMKNASAIDKVCSTFGLTVKDATVWYTRTNWAVDNGIDEEVLKNVANTLHDLRLIENLPSVDRLYENIFLE